MKMTTVFRLAGRAIGYRNNFRIKFERRLSFHNTALTKYSAFVPNLRESRPVLRNQAATLSTSKVFFEEQQPGMIDIKFEELKNLLSSKTVVLVDVREPKELLEDGKILGSLNVPLGEVESAFSLPASQFESKYGGSLPSRDESSQLVISCRSGKRASMAIEKIRKLGYEEARIYSGSFQDWQANGGPLEQA